MTINEAMRICSKIEGDFERKRLAGKKVKWDEIYSTEAEIISVLEKIYIPKNRKAPYGTFKGYEYIYSFAYFVQNGKTLSEAQMKQAKRLATEIKKAEAIADYRF